MAVTLFPEMAVAKSATIAFTVYGKSEPAGSKRAIALRHRDGSLVTRPGGAPVINVTDDNPKSKGWKQQVAQAGGQAYRGPLLEGALAVTFTFYRPRPKGHFTASGTLSRDGREKPYPTSKPDVLKLSRAAEDALTGVIWRDDAQIVSEYLQKKWGDQAKVDIVIRSL